VHAAAALSAAPLAQLDAAQIDGIMRSKVDGALILERLTRSLPLDFLMLFSSTTAILGAAGLAHYAAANSFMDAFARVGGASPVNSINWGTWDVMRLASAESQRGFKEGGMQPMSSADALGAFGRLLDASRPQAIVASVEWNRFKALYEARRVRPLLEELGNESRQAAATAAESERALLQQLESAPPAARREILIGFVQSEAAAVLGVAAAASLALSAGLFDLGMDSLMALELKRRLERGVGITLPSTLTFNYPSVEALAGYLERLIAPQKLPDLETEVAPPTSAAEVPEGLASGEIEALSDDELEERLLARLRQVQ
jgi:acyl carrier protein